MNKLLASIHPRLVELAVRAGLAEFSKIDLGDKPDYPTCAPCCDSPSGPYYPTLYVSGRKEPIDLPDKGKATVEYRIKNRSSNKRDEGDERHSVDIEVHSIEPIEGDKRPKEGQPATLLDDIRRLRLFVSDPRARNSLGEYTSDAGEGVDPNQMAAAYGPPEVSQSHLERVKNFFLKRRQAAAQG